MTRAAAAAPLLLDTLATTAAGAYSTRKLRAAYSGPAIRVVESGASGEADIGFDANGDLDTEALAAHVVGSNNGHIKVWYDQSGNGRDHTRWSSTSMLRCVNGGTNETQNGKVCGKYNGTNIAGYATSAFTAYTGDTAGATMVTALGTGSFDRGQSMCGATLLDWNSTFGFATSRNSTEAKLTTYRNSAAVPSTLPLITNGVVYAISTQFTGSTCVLKHNSSSGSGSSSGAFATTNLLFGADGPTGRAGSGVHMGSGSIVCEAIWFFADPGADLDTVLANQRTYWGAS